MKNQFYLPSFVSFLVCALVILFAVCGVKTSISSAILIVGSSFCFVHLLILSYNLGAAHGERQDDEKYDNERVYEVLSKKPRSVKKESEGSIKDISKKFNPIEDF